MYIEWLDNLKKNYPRLPHEKIAAACSSANEIDPELLAYGLTIADELLPIAPREESIIVAILYPAFHHHKNLEKHIIEKHGQLIWHLLVALQRMSLMDEKSKGNETDFANSHHHIDNLRKMLLAIIDDTRIVLIKLAERLAMLKNIKNESDTVKKAAAEQISTLYAPLANRLGIGQLKWQLEDFAFRYANPEKYKQISKDLNMRRVEREQFIKTMQTKLNKLLIENEIVDAKISGRPKHIYSIYKKTQRKNVGVSEIYDTSALRILVNSVSDCYRALSAVHHEWQPIQSEFDDYIAKPKPNGYQSIHTAIIGPENNNVEIQIRTQKMHDDAELGVAAHWHYKEGGDAHQEIGSKINWLREVLAWQQELDAEKNMILTNLFTDHIYVFTPNGDVLDLPKDATALDFAYHVHTEIGHRCRGAKVNGKIIPLTQSLQTGDHIEILTSKEAQPSRDWLRAESHYLTTAGAKAKVRNWFKKQFYQAHLNSGQAMWEKMQKEHHFPKNALDAVLPELNFKSTKDLLAAMGAGNLGSQAVLQKLRHHFAVEKTDNVPILTTSSYKNKPSNSFIVAGVDEVLTQLARCCNPIPGDEIIGYITQGRGISIHKQQCHNIEIARARKIERLIEAHWPTSSNNRYPVHLQIEAQDRAGLIRDISSVIANENASILSANSRINRADNIAILAIVFDTQSKEQLQLIIKKIEQLPGLLRIRRL